MLTHKKIIPILIILFITLVFIFAPLFFLVSCNAKQDSVENISDGQQTDSSDYGNEDSLYLFDYKKIKLESISSIGIEIKNCNLYIDIYDDLVILGEVKNSTSVSKTNIEITLDFHDKNNLEIIAVTVPAMVNYLKGGSRLPFYYYLTDRQKYIEISDIKIGVNYKDFNEGFKGNPIVESENYYYEGNYLIIEGRVINIGTEKIKNVKLYCTFYNDRDQIVFISECYLPREKLFPEEEQEFTLKLLFDEYLPEFTHYRFEVFSEDEIKEPI